MNNKTTSLPVVRQPSIQREIDSLASIVKVPPVKSPIIKLPTVPTPYQRQSDAMPTPVIDRGIDRLGSVFEHFMGVLFEAFAGLGSALDDLAGDAPVAQRPARPMGVVVYGIPAKVSDIVYDRLKVEGLNPIAVGYVGEGAAREFQFSVIVKLYKVTENILIGMGLNNQYRRIKQ